MAYRILIVDDSTFFRRRVKQILEADPELEVVGEAKNGKEALTMVNSLKPDVVTMDIEMPVMDGITAVKHLMADNPVPIIMFSSLTNEGAQATLDALQAGALDFLPKKFEDIALNRKEAVELLQARVKALCTKKGLHLKSDTAHFTGAKNKQSQNKKIPKSTSTSPRSLSSTSSKQYDCLAIGTSTGGPVALQKILTDLPKTFPVPVLMVQHMPGSFTNAFAKRLNDLCEIRVKEATDGEMLTPGVCYLAPGGKQMTVSGRAANARITISEPDSFPDCSYKPSVDVTFDSVAHVYSSNVLAIILTGMGADGLKGCKTLKSKNATIWAQDEKSCVVYGMPQAVTVAKIAQQNYDIAHMAMHIKDEILN
mgnify:CR=1 FL=1